MTTLKHYFDLVMPEINLPTHGEMLRYALRIKSNDSLEARQAMRTIARFFKREFYYDSVQYAAPWDIENDDECHAYLWTIEKSTVKIKSVVIGGFCFRKRDHNRYGLQWIWIHPYLRNRGLLTQHWPYMKKKFGEDFFVEPPYSDHLQKFLDKKENKMHTFIGGKNKIPYWYDKFSDKGIDLVRKK